MPEVSTNFTNLLDLPHSEVEKWLNSFDTILADCDGTIWHDDTAIPGAPETINALKAHGKRVIFVTNNGTKTRHEVWQRAARLGFNVSETDIISPTQSIVEYLKMRGFRKKVYIIGSKAIAKDLAAAGIEYVGTSPDVLQESVETFIKNELIGCDTSEVGAVVVGFDEHFSYCKMMKASNYLGSQADCLFIATNSDAVHRYPAYDIPGTGAIVQAIEHCVGRKALELGKPNAVICEQLKLRPERTLMVGDCCKIDVAFGRNCGFRTLLVGTGNYNLDHLLRLSNEAANQKFMPDFYLPKLGDLLSFIQKE